jgi:hypothetical protein
MEQRFFAERMKRGAEMSIHLCPSLFILMIANPLVLEYTTTGERK